MAPALVHRPACALVRVCAGARERVSEEEMQRDKATEEGGEMDERRSGRSGTHEKKSRRFQVAYFPVTA